MLLLGVIQAQASGAVAAGSFDLLETQVLSSSAASVTFSGLSAYAADYQHLQIRIAARSTRADTESSCYIQFNSDTGSNYSQHYLRGNGSNVESGFLSGSFPSGIMLYQGLAGNTNTANSFAGMVIDILDPFESTKYTTTRALTGFTGSLNRVLLQSGSWRNTNAVTSITFDDIYGDFAQYSRFSLYGWKAA